MEKVAQCQLQIDIPLNLFSILSKTDNLLMFCISKDGLKTNSNILHNDIPTKKRYYKALKQLKDAGLIEKSSKYKGTYFHTTYGSIVYQREIIEMSEYKKQIEKMKMIDNIKKVNKYSNTEILKLIQDVIDNDITINNSVTYPSIPSSLSSEIIMSYEQLVPSMIKKIRECNNELLIATRLGSEELINEIILKAKIGVNVKILADTKLVEGYFKSQNKNSESNNGKENENENERIKVIANPWYPNSEGVERRVCNIPFGILVIDGKEAGVELINRNDSQNFFAGIIIRDEKFASMVKELYFKIWDTTPNNSDLLTANA
jgi:DNA-binding PadR family transcriptional regulator